MYSVHIISPTQQRSWCTRNSNTLSQGYDGFSFKIQVTNPGTGWSSHLAHYELETDHCPRLGYARHSRHSRCLRSHHKRLVGMGRRDRHWVQVHQGRIQAVGHHGEKTDKDLCRCCGGGQSYCPPCLCQHPYRLELRRTLGRRHLQHLPEVASQQLAESQRMLD